MLDLAAAYVSGSFLEGNPGLSRLSRGVLAAKVACGREERSPARLAYGGGRRRPGSQTAGSSARAVTERAVCRRGQQQRRATRRLAFEFGAGCHVAT
jgi:hypothetical protein